MAVLDDRKRRFCRLVAVERLNQTEAYAQVFGCKRNSAATLAGRLMKTVEVQEEIQRLSTEVKVCTVRAAVAAHCWSKVERQERLQRWADELMEAGKPAEAIRCIDLLNKMDGAYVQEREVDAVEDAVVQMRRAILDGTSGRPMVKQYG